MEFSVFEEYFSASRVERYQVAVGNSKIKTIKLYKANLKVSQAFHPLLGVLEVIIRNRLNDILVEFFNDKDWIINQKSEFMSDPSLRFRHKRSGKIIINDFIKREVEKAETRILKTNSKITSGKIIAEQSFGFWTDFFEVHNYKLLKGKPIQVFNNLPSGYGRKEVNDLLNNIRRFRNRINHNEPICFNKIEIDFSNSLLVYNAIINLLNWIDPELINFTSDIDSVLSTIEKALKLKKPPEKFSEGFHFG